MEKKYLIVYDFDWSLADEDTDYHALKKFGKDIEQVEVEKKAWIDMMNQKFELLYENKVSVDQLLSTFSDFPVSKYMVQAIKLANQKAADLVIVSDGNTLFLNTVLTKYQLTNCFKQICTNKLMVEEGGKCILTPAMDLIGYTCPTEIETVGLKVSQLKKEGRYVKTIYVGDGKNDFCAGTHLEKGDLFLVRKGRALEKILQNKSNLDQVQAEVQFWQGAQEVLQWFQNEF